MRGDTKWSGSILFVPLLCLSFLISFQILRNPFKERGGGNDFISRPLMKITRIDLHPEKSGENQHRKRHCP